jgi:hypothetical protein
VCLCMCVLLWVSAHLAASCDIQAPHDSASASYSQDCNGGGPKLLATQVQEVRLRAHSTISSTGLTSVKRGVGVLSAGGAWQLATKTNAGETLMVADRRDHDNVTLVQRIQRGPDHSGHCGSRTAVRHKTYRQHTHARARTHACTHRYTFIQTTHARTHARTHTHRYLLASD